MLKSHGRRSPPGATGRWLLACALLLVAAPARAEDPYPTRPIHVVVPFAAGGVIDVVTRVVAEHMAGALKQPLVIDNRPGAGSTIGASAVAKAAPDGYTLLVNGAAHSVIPALYPQANFDVTKDFEPVSILGRVPFVLAVHPSLPATGYASFIAYLKSNPGKVDFGSTGAGSAAHLSSELLKHMAGVEFEHIPYRGTPAVVTDLLAGRIGFMIDAQNLLATHIQSGALRGFAVTTLKRSSLLPALPTFDELGLKGYDSSSWQAMYAPAKTPRPIIDRLAASIAAALADPAVLDRFRSLGIERPDDLGPEKLDAYFNAEMAKWGPIIAATGATAN
jgi:tripartite-type tricarboxylate transporter receptor subunit TctC